MHFVFHCFPFIFLNWSKDFRDLGLSTLGGGSASKRTKMFHLIISCSVHRDYENISQILLFVTQQMQCLQTETKDSNSMGSGKREGGKGDSEGGEP